MILHSNGVSVEKDRHEPRHAAKLRQAAFNIQQVSGFIDLGSCRRAMGRNTAASQEMV